jgi:hypothetical protein
MDVDPLGIEYSGDRANGIVIDHRFADSWLVSFRPTGPGRQGNRYYRNPVDAADAVVAGKHNARGQAGRPLPSTRPTRTAQARWAGRS